MCLKLFLPGVEVRRANVDVAVRGVNCSSHVHVVVPVGLKDHVEVSGLKTMLMLNMSLNFERPGQVPVLHSQLEGCVCLLQWGDI